ncbi:MAG: hypothetical protein EB026_11415, partial [Betaproteobacteria bacterium]|nr:hypothetical protein [Betaproteobacteria bacterium]
MALSALALCWILLPLYGAILWALIIAILFAPVYRHLSPLLHHRRNLAAGLVMLLVFLVGVLPFALVTAALGRDASVVYRRIAPKGCSHQCEWQHPDQEHKQHH